MKHVWILNHYATAPGEVGGMRHFSLARHLPSYGWKATIIAAATNHATGEQRLGKGERFRLETHQTVPFLWLRTSRYSGNGGRRIRNMVDYTRAVLRRDNLSDLELPDAVIGSSVHPLAAWAARRLARRNKVPFLFEVRDLWPQTLIDMGRVSHNHPAAIMLRRLETSLYRDASRIIVLLPKAGDYIEPLGIEPERIVWIPNGVDVDVFPSPRPRTDANTFTLMYLGAHGQANGLDDLLRAMRIVGDDPAGRHIELRLIGDGPMKNSLIEVAQELRLNVKFEEPVPKAIVPKMADGADAFVICVRNLPGLYRYGISMNKIFDYLAAGRPTVISVGATNNPIAEAGAGITVPPGNPKALASAIMEMAALPLSKRNEMGKAGRKHLEANYSMKILAGRLASVLNESLQT